MFSSWPCSASPGLLVIFAARTFYANVEAFVLPPPTSRCPSEPDAEGSAYRPDPALRWDLPNGAGGLCDTNPVTGHRVKMGCCLPGPSNPAMAGNLFGEKMNGGGVGGGGGVVMLQGEGRRLCYLYVNMF